MSQPWCYKWVGGHTSQKNWMRVRGPLPKTLNLFRPKSVIFPYFYAIWPKIRYPTFDRCGWHGCRKYNLWRAFVDGLTVQFKTRVQNHTLFMIKMAKIDSPIMTKTESPIRESTPPGQWISCRIEHIVGAWCGVIRCGGKMCMKALVMMTIV